MNNHILLFLISVFVLVGCSEEKQDGRLTRIADIVADSPQEALQSLDSINSDSLSEADRYYYDFLTLKAQDKAYVPHTSDSLYLRVHDYYAKKGSDDFFTEVLYYGGRVYSDLGDYPTALQYFHQALDRLPEDTDNLSLRGCVLSQTGRLLNTLRLYDEAIPYFVSSLENVRKNK